jgi:hypothetical protein
MKIAYENCWDACVSRNAWNNLKRSGFAFRKLLVFHPISWSCLNESVSRLSRVYWKKQESKIETKNLKINKGKRDCKII